MIEELEQKIINSNEDVFNADEIKKRNEKNQKKQPRKKNPQKKTSSASNSRKKPVRRGRNKPESSDEEMDIEDSSNLSQKQVEIDAARIL